MFKSKTTMQRHKRKQSEMNPPITTHPSSFSNFQTQSKSFPTQMETTREAINNTTHPSSAFGPSFPCNMQQNYLPPSTSHMQINNTNHFPSSFQPAIRPSFLYDMRQNSSSSSSSLQSSVRPNVHHNSSSSSSLHASVRPNVHHNSSSSSSLQESLQVSVRPNVHHNSSSSSSSSRSQSLKSQPHVHEQALHPSSSANSLLNQDLMSQVEINLADQYEKNLESEVEIIDGNGNILRTQKMTVKQVRKLQAGEKVLVHVNKLYQPIKNAGGLCSRFMTLLLNEPNLCPPDAKDWKECKDSCAAMLIEELRRRFSLPQGESVDKVLSALFSKKRRGVKYRFKMSLYQQAANKLNEASGEEKNYTDDELLAALDLLEPPKNFLEHQWRVYKSNLRKPIAKKLSLCGKKARNDQVHTHTTGAVSFARKKDIFLVENKREANDFESFHICYKTTDGTYLQESTRDMMVIADREISRKVKELVGPEGIAEDAVVAQIARDVVNELLGDEEPHCYGAGVTKSQISKFCCDLRRMRAEIVADENRFLKEKVDTQAKEIHAHKKQLEVCNKELETCKKQLATQNKKVETYQKQVETQGLRMKNMEQKLNELYGMLKLLPAFPDLDNVANVASTSTAAGTCDNQPSSSTSPSPFMDEDNYSPVMDDPSFGY